MLTFEPDLVHGPFVPATVYQGMGIHAVLQVGTQKYPLRVLRLSPQGMDLEWTQSLDCVAGQSLFMRLTVGSQTVPYYAVVVVPKRQEIDALMVGVKYESRARQEKPTNASREARLHMRWRTDRRYFPTGTAPSVLGFNSDVYFSVADISNSGLRLLTSLRNKFIVPGLEFEAKIQFPYSGQAKVSMIVRNIDVVREGTETLQAIGVQMVAAGTAYDAHVQHYLTQFSKNASHEPQAVGKQITMKQAVRRGSLDWSFAEIPQDYTDVESFYEICATNILGERVLVALKKQNDPSAKLLIGRLRQSIVAVCEIKFHDANDADASDSRAALTPGLQKKSTSSVEIRRFAFHQGHPQDLLLAGMLRCAYIIAYQSGRRYMVCSDSSVSSVQLKHMGFRSITTLPGMSSSNKLGERVPTADILKVLSGAHIGPFVWQKLFARVSDVAPLQFLDDLGLVGTTRLRVYRALHRLGSAGDKLFQRQA